MVLKIETVKELKKKLVTSFSRFLPIFCRFFLVLKVVMYEEKETIKPVNNRSQRTKMWIVVVAYEEREIIKKIKKNWHFNKI